MKILHVMTPRKKKDGSTFWMRVGTAFDGDKGIGIELDAFPVPDAEGRCTLRLFEPRDDQSRGGGQTRGGGRPPVLDDDIPFQKAVV
jgi:hypothetical protein